MKRIMLQSAMLSIAPMIAYAAAGEGAPAPEPAAPKVVREQQNGFTRPVAGSKTGLVWDIADKISGEKKRPALRDEVIAEYKKQVADARNGTVSTQYSRWCGFHGVQDVLRKMRAEEKAKETAIKDEEKAAKAKAKADAKIVKDKEKADAKAGREKAAAEKKAVKEKAAADKKAVADKAAADKAAAAAK